MIPKQELISDKNDEFLPEVVSWSLSPGRMLHLSWWDHLELGSWQPEYGKSRKLTRELDQLIRNRAKLPGLRQLIMPYTEKQVGLLRMYHRLPQLINALGVLLLGCPDYLIIREYRVALQKLLDTEALYQIRALWRNGVYSPEYTADQLPEIVWQYGYSAINMVFDEDVLWGLIRVQLPFISMISLIDYRCEYLWKELCRLERLL